MRSVVAHGFSSERETCSAFERVMRGLKECPRARGEMANVPLLLSRETSNYMLIASTL